MEKINLVVLPQDAGMRLDSFLAKEGSLSRALVQQLIQQQMVWVNDKTAVKSYRVLTNDIIEIEILELETEIIPQDIPLSICYEDEYLLVVNKPKGMVVHPAAGNAQGTLVNALLYHCGDRLSYKDSDRPGIVHRIDKDTSGLLVVAKDNETHDALAKQFAIHSNMRLYQAVVYGNVKQDTGTIEGAIGRDPKNRKRMAVNPLHGKYAVTHYCVLGRYEGFSHMELRLETGRTHQIRVHMASIGHPLAGDAVYGPKKIIGNLDGQCLHAKSLGFVHPATGEEMLFDSDLPPYFTSFLHKLREKTNT